MKIIIHLFCGSVLAGRGIGKLDLNSKGIFLRKPVEIMCSATGTLTGMELRNKEGEVICFVPVAKMQVSNPYLTVCTPFVIDSLFFAFPPGGLQLAF